MPVLAAGSSVQIGDLQPIRLGSMDFAPAHLTSPVSYRPLAPVVFSPSRGRA